MFTKLNSKQVTKYLALLGLFFVLFYYFSLFFTTKINTSNSDIGRHIINGLNLVNGNYKVLTTDFYSYTYPYTSHVNHHYLSGVVFYLITTVGGFLGLSVFYAFLGGLFIFLLFYYGYKKLGITFALLLTLLFLPFLSLRTEVRPEMFTYIFFTAQALVLAEHRGKLKPGHYLLIFMMQALCINLHNYAVFAFFLTASFMLEALIAKDYVNFKKLTFMIGVQVLATLATPYGPKIFLVPLEPFIGMGVGISENEPLLDKELLLLFATMGLVCSAACIFINSYKSKLGLPIITTLFALLALFMGRILILFAIVFYIFSVDIFKYIPSKYTELFEKKLGLVMPILMLMFLTVPFTKNFGYGLLPGVEKGGEFFLNNKVPGPIYNDYNVGGYVIYYTSIMEPLSKQGKKVYVHNVPESLPVDFLSKWLDLYSKGDFSHTDLETYKFESIFISTDSEDPIFLLKRINDPMWKLVFYDDYVAILVRNNNKNAELIKKHEVPADVKEYIMRKEVDSYDKCETVGYKTIKNVCVTCKNLCITPWAVQFLSE